MKQYRVVGLGDYHNYLSYFTYGIAEGAIRCGAWFRPVPLFGQSLGSVFDQIDFFKPHVIVAHMIFNRQPHNIGHVFEMLRNCRRKFGCKILYHAGDARTEPRYAGDVSDFLDGALVNHGLLEKFSGIWKIPCYHWPYSCLYQKDIADKHPLYVCDISFTGMLSNSQGHVHNERTLFIRKLIEKLRSKVKVFPNNETGNTRFQTAEMASSAKVILGVGMAEHIPLYLDVRPFQYIGAGAIYFHDDGSDVMEKFFVPWLHYVKYKKNSVEDFIEKFKYIEQLHNDPKFKLRESAFSFCQMYHSTKERFQFILDLVEEKKTKSCYYIEDVL